MNEKCDAFRRHLHFSYTRDQFLRKCRALFVFFAPSKQGNSTQNQAVKENTFVPSRKN